MLGVLTEQDAITATESLEYVKLLLAAGAKPNAKYTWNHIPHGGMMPATMFNPNHTIQSKPTVLDLILVPLPDWRGFAPIVPGGPDPAQVKAKVEQQMKTKRELILLLRKHGAKTAHELNAGGHEELGAPSEFDMVDPIP